MSTFWRKNIPRAHNRTWRQRAARRRAGEKQKREQALRGVIAALRSLNRELKDFTGEIPGASAPPAAVGAERPPLSVTCWPTAACEGFELSKSSPVPDPRLARYPHQSVIVSPGASLSQRVNARVCVYRPSFQKRGEHAEKWRLSRRNKAWDTHKVREKQSTGVNQLANLRCNWGVLSPVKRRSTGDFHQQPWKLVLHEIDEKTEPKTRLEEQPLPSCTGCHLPSRAHNRHICSLLRHSRPAQEQGLFNGIVVRHSVGLGVNHMLSFQARIIILLFAAGLPAAPGPSACVRPALASLRLSRNSGISRL